MKRNNGAVIEECLKWIERFGFLRGNEVAQLLYPGNSQSGNLALRLLRTTEAQEFTCSKKLPNDIKLHFLTSEGRKEIGKESGETINVIPKSWEHDLIVTQILIHYHRKNYNFLTERELRTMDLSSEKIPDGLIEMSDGSWTWLEVELAKKSGKAMDLQIKWIQKANEGMEWNGLQIRGAIIACPANSARNHIQAHVTRLHSVVRGFTVLWLYEYETDRLANIKSLKRIIEFTYGKMVEDMTKTIELIAGKTSVLGSTYPTSGTCRYQNSLIHFHHELDEEMEDFFGKAGETGYIISGHATEEEARLIIADAGFKEWKRLQNARP